MSIDTDTLEEMSYATHDEAAANLVDVLAATAATSAQVLTRLGNPRAREFAAFARDLCRWAGALRGRELETGPHLRLVE